MINDNETIKNVLQKLQKVTIEELQEAIEKVDKEYIKETNREV